MQERTGSVYAFRSYGIERGDRMAVIACILLLATVALASDAQPGIGKYGVAISLIIGALYLPFRLSQARSDYRLLTDGVQSFLFLASPQGHFYCLRQDYQRHSLSSSELSVVKSDGETRLRLSREAAWRLSLYLREWDRQKMRTGTM